MYAPKCLEGTSPQLSKYQFQGHNTQSQLRKRVGKKLLLATAVSNLKFTYVTLTKYVPNSQEKIGISGSFSGVK
jgi:hypothetical protein